MRFLISLLFLFAILNAEDTYKGDVYADEAYEMQKKGEAIIVDVRTEVEFMYVGHGEGFINIPAFNWSLEPKAIDERIKSAQWEIKNSKVKDHATAMKLYNEKETLNKNFVNEVISAMKANNVSKVILVCRSGPRSKAAANMLSKEGIEAYNLDGGFVFGWRETNMPWGGN